MNTNAGNASGFNRPITVVLFCLRLAVGWHFLYEGLAKLLIPGWTAAPYLQLARGSFAGFFHWLAAHPALLRAVDRMNIWGLMLIGLALLLGCFCRVAAGSGMGLLVLYYLAHPPFILTDYRIPVEGHYLVIDKNVVELLALAIFLVIPTGYLWGVGRFLRRWWGGRRAKPQTETATAPVALSSALSRREALEDLAAVPIAGVLGYTAKKKYDWEKVHAITGATIKLPNLSLKDLNGTLPQGNLGKFKVSRLILGGNLIGGWSHSRDLIYVSSLFKAYNTDRKVFETLELAERAGINSFLAVTAQMPLFNKYLALNKSRMQSICQVFPEAHDYKSDIDRAIDYGVTSIYIQGVHAEVLVRDGHADVLCKALDHIKSQGFQAGMGSHSIEIPLLCEREGIEPDYYMKTFHHDNYWSAHPRANRVEGSIIAGNNPEHNYYHDNMFDLFPEKTVDFMARCKKPWIAFKVLAGGAIKPEDGFRYAFEHGADFICVGMFDFQIIQDVNVCNKVLSSLNRGPRPWFS